EPLEIHGGELPFQEQEKYPAASKAQFIGRQIDFVDEHAAIHRPWALASAFQHLACRVILLKAILKWMAQNQHFAFKLLECVRRVLLRCRPGGGDHRQQQDYESSVGMFHNSSTSY